MAQTNIARLWEVAGGQLVRTFVGHNFWIWSVGFSPDGKYCTHRQPGPHRPACGTPTPVSNCASFPATAMRRSPTPSSTLTGRNVVIGSFDGVAQRTPVDLDALIHSVCGRLLRDLTAEERTIYGIDDNEATCQAN